MSLFIGLLDDEIVRASAKTGIGISDVLESVVKHIPPPTGDASAPVRALIFDLHYDAYKGVIAYVKVVDGEIGRDDRLRLMATGKEADVLELGFFSPNMTPSPSLSVGEVGYIATGLKAVKDLQVGDTDHARQSTGNATAARPRPAMSMVFAGLYPSDSSATIRFSDALDKLQLNEVVDLRRNRPSRSVSASAADSSACCTWRSFRNDSSASSISISWSRPRGGIRSAHALRRGRQGRQPVRTLAGLSR
ncbi:MAG: hypothetical protein R2843_07305 [Thermomicrobiales bacterium]